MKFYQESGKHPFYADLFIRLSIGKIKVKFNPDTYMWGWNLGNKSYCCTDISKDGGRTKAMNELKKVLIKTKNELSDKPKVNIKFMELPSKRIEEMIIRKTTSLVGEIVDTVVHCKGATK